MCNMEFGLIEISFSFSSADTAIDIKIIHITDITKKEIIMLIIVENIFLKKDFMS